MTTLIENFISVYKNLHKDNVPSIESIYSSDVVFIDPFKQIHGIEHVKLYFTDLYQQVNSCDFDFTSKIQNDNAAAIFWSMKISHQRINKGKTICVPGCTQISYTDKISYHRDYFDAATLIYEHIPVLGYVIKTLKERL